MIQLTFNRSTCALALGAALAASACQNDSAPSREVAQPTTVPPAAGNTEVGIAAPSPAPANDERVNVVGTVKAKDVMEEADSDMKEVLEQLGAVQPPKQKWKPSLR